MDEAKPKEKSIIAKTISSESFLEKVIILLLTVLISGLLIPYITNEIQRTKTSNEIILQAQNKLLEDVSKTLLTYETLLLDISWFKSPQAYNEKMHQRAFERYTDRAVDLLAEWRLESVKARSLSSVEISAALDSFQLKMFNLQDTPMNELYTKNGSVNEWQKLHNVNAEMLFEANDLIFKIAKDMNITKNNLK